MAASYRLGDYLLAMEGLAILRSWGTDSMAVAARVAEIAGIIEALDMEPYSSIAEVPEYDVAGGYGAWAANYDAMPNILVDLEERIVRPSWGPSPPDGPSMPPAEQGATQAGWQRGTTT